MVFDGGHDVIQAKGRYRQGHIELEQSLDVPEGASVELTIRTTTDDDDWRELGMDRLESEWHNELDSVYDDWRRLYGIQQP
jgi:hypothetical protein